MCQGGWEENRSNLSHHPPPLPTVHILSPHPLPAASPALTLLASDGICSSLARDITYRCLFQENQLRNHKLRSRRKVTAQAINTGVSKLRVQVCSAYSPPYPRLPKQRFSWGKMKEYPARAQKGVPWVFIPQPVVWNALGNSKPLVGPYALHTPTQTPGLFLFFPITVIASWCLKCV